MAAEPSESEGARIMREHCEYEDDPLLPGDERLAERIDAALARARQEEQEAATDLEAFFAVMRRPALKHPSSFTHEDVDAADLVDLVGRIDTALRARSEQGGSRG